MTIEEEEETEAEEETNAEAENLTTPNVKGKEVDAEDEDTPNSHTNISAHMVAAHTSVLNESPKETGTKTPPPLKKCREAAPLIVSGCDDVGPI